MATNPIRIFVVLDAGVDRDALDGALPPTTDVHLVGIADSLDAVEAGHHATADVLVVACAGPSERALLVIDSTKMSTFLVNEASRLAEACREELRRFTLGDGVSPDN